MRRLAPLLVVLVALAACSGEDQEAGSTAGTTTAAAPELDPRLVPLLTQGPGGPTQEPRIGHATARRICSSMSHALLGEAYATDPSEQRVTDETAARLDAPDEVREAVRDGCLKGFPARAACIDSWDAPDNADAREALPARARVGDVYVIGAAHTPALVAVDACVLVFAGERRPVHHP